MQRTSTFDPAACAAFRFAGRRIDPDGTVSLTYALDDLGFTEVVEIPVPAPLTAADRERVDGLVALLHWVAGVSYFKAAAPPVVECGTGDPGPATARLLEALYSDGLGEYAFVNGIPLPRPVFPASPLTHPGASAPPSPAEGPFLVPVGGGKDSVVALEIVRASGADLALFSVGDAPAIRRTAEVAGLPRLVARRRIDPALIALNADGALNGHVPVTAIVTCIALLTAALNGFRSVALANERSASQGNLVWDGVEVNHQFSKGRVAEVLMAAAVAEAAPGLTAFSLLRPASELAIARAFARLDRYHHAFTSCNTVFRLDATRRGRSWCRDCPKCRFVFLVLAPFSDPAHLRDVFGADLLADPAQYPGFALLTATGGSKPFECVGEEEESLAAVRLLARDPRWSDHAVVRRLAAEVLPAARRGAGEPEEILRLHDDHSVPAILMPAVRALLGS